ncbi:MAG: hypothetical protein ACNA8K_14715 [Cyclonatronaceae bacterium]
MHYSYNKKPNRRNKVNVFHNGHRFSESTGPPVLLHLLFLTLFLGTSIKRITMIFQYRKTA